MSECQECGHMGSTFGGICRKCLTVNPSLRSGGRLPPEEPDLVTAKVGVPRDPAMRRSLDAIKATCDEICDLLMKKNEAYGDSALNPVRVFSKADPVEQIKVRLDDKLSRLARGSDAGEDVVLDLIGYLVLLRIAQKRYGA